MFELSDKACISDSETRNYIRAKIQEDIGVPFWSVKYLPSEKFGGEDSKTSCETH